MCSGTTAALVLPTSTVDLRVAALGGVLVEHLRPGWEAWSARRLTSGRTRICELEQQMADLRDRFRNGTG